MSPEQIINRLREILLPQEPNAPDETLIYEALVWDTQRRQERFLQERCVFGRCTGTAENLFAITARNTALLEDLQQQRELLEMATQALAEVAPRHKLLPVIRRDWAQKIAA